MADLIVNAMFGRGLGGLERAFVHVGAALSAAGYEVVNVLSDAAAIAAQFPADVRVTAVRQSSQWDLGAIARLQRLHQQLRPAAVLTHGARAGMLFARALSGRAPLAAMLHSARLKRLGAFDMVIGVTRTLADSAIAAGMDPARVRYAPNLLIDATAVERAPAFGRAARIGFLGRLAPEKGADRLIAALLHRHAAGMAPLKLTIAGDGPQRAALEKQAAPLGADVAFVGWRSDPEAFLADIDVLVAPSRAEVFGMVILEAWRAGAVVLATRADGPLELIEDGVTGVLSGGEPAPLAAALERVVADGDLRVRLAAGGRARLPDFAMATVAPMLGAAIADLVTMRGARRVP
jgi:glycosyltransferase involved in cell wall biosynthesis